MPKNVWEFLHRGRSPDPEPEREQLPEPPDFFVLKVGGFEIRIDQASFQAMAPALPVVFQLGRRSFSHLLCVLIGVIGTASLQNNKLLAQLVQPADPMIEEVCPQR